MAFVDEVRIHAVAGDGGDGVVRWLHVKGKEKGGPSGGDGGRGGDIIAVGVRDLAALSRYRFEKNFKAEDGKPGEGRNRTGEGGSSCELLVPVGTEVRNEESGETFEVNTEGERVTIFSGGAGGKGNASFKGSTNQNPFIAKEGKRGAGGDIVLTLTLIAEAGLIGLPNAGKSSLLNALTNAKSKVGAYPFTTLEPYLGDFHGHVLADIPGLISGASKGKGLGAKFLRHIEKTRILLHLVSVDQEDPLAAYREVRRELESSGPALSEKPEVVILSKTDLVSKEVCETVSKALAIATGRKVLGLSIRDDASLHNFSRELSRLLA